MPNQTPIVTSPSRSADPAQAMLSTMNSQWIKTSDCSPPLHVEFFGLYSDGADYSINHIIRDGVDDSMMNGLKYWWPSPALPKIVVDGFEPHDQSLGRRALVSLKKWFSEVRAKHVPME